MDSEQAARILTPLWIAFAVAEERLEALLAESFSQPMTRENAPARLRHEAELEEVRAYLQAKARGFRGAGLRDAVATGRAVLIWPNACPSEAVWERTLQAWRDGRAAKVKPLEVGA